MIRLGFLERVGLFKRLNDDQLSLVRKCCVEKEYKRGDKLFCKGEDAKYIWIVIDGLIDLHFDLPEGFTMEEGVISSLSQTMTLGWSSIMPPYKYKLSACCTTRKCKVLRLDAKELKQICEKDVKIGYLVMANLAAVVSKRFHQLQDQVAERRGHDIMHRW